MWLVFFSHPLFIPKLGRFPEALGLEICFKVKMNMEKHDGYHCGDNSSGIC